MHVVGGDTFSLLAPVLDPELNRLAMSPFPITHGGRYDYNSKGFFATGERTPALAMRMTVITEVIGNRIPKRDSTAKGHT